MKHLACAFMALFLGHAAWAQDLPPDISGDGGFEIEESESGHGQGWSRYIGGTFGAVSADGDTVSRQLVALQLDINLPATDRLKTVISADFADFENSYTQKFRNQFRLRQCKQASPDGSPLPIAGELPDDASDDEIRRSLDWEGFDCRELVSDGDYLPEERETKVADSFVDFSEAYVQWQPVDFATLTVGRQNLVWGQFEFASPVGFLLPYSGTNTSPRPSRSDFSYAQDAVNLALFPTTNSELQLIHVPQMRLEPSVEENLKSYSQLRYCDRDSNGAFDCPPEFESSFPDIADYDMSALRFTHYGERLTFAITALDGALVSFDPYLDAVLVQNDEDHFEFTQDRGLIYSDLETVALEFAYILNPRVTIKGEFTTYEANEALSPETGSRDDNAMAQAIVDVKQGRPYITHDEVFFSLGFAYESDDWFGHFQLVSFDFEPATQADNVLECVEDLGIYERNVENPAASTCRNAEEEDDEVVAPIFFVGQRLGDGDEGFVGGGATAFFNAYGFGFFGGWRFNENIEVGGFIGSVIDVTDSGPPHDEHYESLDDGDALAQIGFSYLF